MNSFERMMNRLMGQEVDRPPNFNIYMTFAAHFIRQPLSEYYLNYRTLVDANMAMVEHFHADIVQAISDPYREATGLGLDVQFPHDALPLSSKPLIDDPVKVARMVPVQPTASPRMNDRLQAIRLLREKIGNEIPVMGWVEGALAEAGDLRGIGEILMDLLEEPPWLNDLLEICAFQEIEFARAQVAAGAHIIGLGDAIASQVSPEMYLKYALPYEQRIFKAVHEMGALARLHICGNTEMIVPYMVESGADIIDLDWMVNWTSAIEKFGGQVSFCGNFDPVAVMHQGTPDSVYHATLNCMRTGGKHCFSAAGCEIPDGTPHDNLLAQHKALLECQK